MLSAKPQWVALYTNPRAEKAAERNLRESGFEVYLPLRRELHTWSDRKKWVEEPLLKSYVFARITQFDESVVCNVRGVSHLVKFQNVVATIPEEEIQMMRDFIASEVDIQVRTSEKLKRGRRVRINSGNLAGKVGVLVSDCEDGNFAVEITGISMAMIVHVDKDLMETLPEDSEQKPKTKKKYTVR
ncbi:MAG: UpxY family transcription antiterminator [Bacteroidales bacterium]|nr:UpxY family transcription antiterminator [Bacteroidales bacterium]